MRELRAGQRRARGYDDCGWWDMYGHFPPARFVLGKLGLRQPLIVRSYRPEGGVIFSDGIEADYVSFNAGAVATIGVEEKKARLVARE